jgi:hypothetical protein
MVHAMYRTAIKGEEELRNGCLAQLVERRPYKA